MLCDLPARALRLLAFALSLALLGSLSAAGQARTVAITVDDLPYVGQNATPAAASEAVAVNRVLLNAFRNHHVPVTGFVIEQRVGSLGPTTGKAILQTWTSQGFDLGNHTYSHPDINELSVSQIENEITRGEITIGPLMKAAGKRVEFFRFPMNHTGDTKAKHDALAEFLAQHGYHLATCTIDNSDYLFNTAYLRMLANNDKDAALKLRQQYLLYTDTEIDYYSALNKQVLNYEPPQVMLLHDNRLNADVIEELLALLDKKHYTYVSLATAQSDPAYAIPDSYITPYGPMWGYRWGRERNVKFDGKLEPEPPQWILDYGQKKPSH